MTQTENIEVYQDGQLISSDQIQYTDLDIIRFETEKYLSRKIDGEKTFLAFAADLRLKKLNGVFTSVEFEQIEELLVPVRTEITLGQWKTALKKLQEINPISIGEDLYGKIETTISDYILQNYQP